MKEHIFINYENQDLYLGIDVHLKSWKVAIRCKGVVIKRFSMEADGDMLVKHLKNQYPKARYHLVYEAGFCGFSPYRIFQKAGMNCIVVNPADVPRSHKEKTYKNDKNDAAKLARELENGSLRTIYIPTEAQDAFRQLVRYRSRLIQKQTRIKNQIKSTLYYTGIKTPKDFEGRRWSVAFLNWLKLELKKQEAALKLVLESYLDELSLVQLRISHIEERTRHLIKENKLEEEIRQIQSCPGIGEKSALILYSEIMDIKRFSNEEKLNSYVGLIPATYSSGEKERDIGLSFRRNKYLRNVLIESAWTAIRLDLALAEAYQDLSKRMAKNKAIVRIAKKLLNRIRKVWLNKENYQLGLIS